MGVKFITAGGKKIPIHVDKTFTRDRYDILTKNQREAVLSGFNPNFPDIDITKAQAMRISKFPFTTLTKVTKERIRGSIGGAKLNEWGKLNGTITTRKSNVC